MRRALPETLEVGTQTLVESAAYTALGQPALVEYGGAGLNLQTTYTYNADDQRLQRLRVGTSGQLGKWVNLWYTYDLVGNVETVRDWRWVGAVQLKQTSTYGYDALDRLVSAEASGAGAWGAYEREYTYNAIGNLTARSYDPVHEEVTYSYPASGENSVRPHAVSSTSEGGSFAYDANGNMTSRRLKTGGREWTQVWDAENRLKSVAYEGVTQTITVTFTYDGQGSLVARETPTDTTVFVGGVYEKNLDTGGAIRYYFFGGRRVAMKKGSTLYYLFGDHLGTTSLVMNSAGTAIIAEARHREASRSVA